jgi:replication-associated recombination protein RarA
VKPTSPAQFAPVKPGDFIGPAAQRAKVIDTKCRRLKAEGGNLKLLLYGAPGAGKTRLAEMAAATLANHSTEIVRLNGRNLTSEVVRQWMDGLQYQSVLGGWTVKLVDELDLATPQAQDLLLSYLDALPATHAVIGTSNLHLASLTDRFQTRFQQMRVDLPDTAELSEFLRKRWRLPKPAADAIAVGSGGNVRAALLDTETYLDERSVA